MLLKDLRFTSHWDASSGQICFQFPIERFKEWAATLNDANTVVQDVESLFNKCSISESNGATAVADPSHLPGFDSLVSQTSEALYVGLPVPDNLLSSQVLGAVLKRFEEDVVEGLPAVVDRAQTRLTSAMLYGQRCGSTCAPRRAWTIREKVT